MDDWAEIRRLHRSEKMGIKAIALRLGLARNRSALGGGMRSRAAEPAHVFVPGQS